MGIRDIVRLSLLCLLASLGQAQAGGLTLRLGGDKWPPFTEAEGKPRDAVNLVESALLRGGLKSEFSIVSWSTVMKQLETGQLDGAVAMWKTPEREAFMLFSRPYLENRLVLVARKGTDVSAASVAALAGKRLAITGGYAYGDEVTAAPNVRILRLENDAECLRAVLDKRADYLLLDELMVRHLFDEYPDKAQKLIVAGTVPVVSRELHLALRKSYPRAREILAEFDQNVDRMVQDGTYNVLLHVPWISRDVDGDGEPEYIASTKSTLSSGGDPGATHGGYPLFNPSPATAPVNHRAPEYVIDGKSYNNWSDAATTLERAGGTIPQGAYKYSTGFVLGTF
ncbi:MAG TPA: transporter substrate-binding domain-containing protein [Polyangiaceae bacterium]|nr:transporter substrate-binding domain-containing protein [Polyangiaceae bacterium]